MKGDVKILEILNDLLAGELSASDQYLLHAEVYADAGLHHLAAKANHESEHERMHARALMQRILFLEGRPDMSRREPIVDGASIVDMLEADLRLEYKVVGELKKAIAVCEASQDFVTREVLASQLDETEMDHAYWLERQLRLIKLTGLENYLQSQMQPGDKGASL